MHEIKQQFLMFIPENMEVLPTPYGILKMHKSPFRSRFIIASKQCVVKPLSENITATFKLFKSMEKHNNKSKLCMGVDLFWVIQKNVLVIDALNKLSNQAAANSFSTYYFSTLCTNIPYAELIKTLNSLTDFAFKGMT